jgi:hypothetical protein
METLVHWKLAEELNPRQAALLMLGLDPARFSSALDSRPSDQPRGYEAFITALKNGITNKRIEARISYYENSTYDCDAISWEDTVLAVESLKNWLVEKNIRDPFFNTGGGIMEFSFMDENHPQYSPKLAATVSAWIAVTDNPELLNRKTPKQAVEKWLRENANQFGLTKDDGKLNESAITEICKIVNWNPQGGVAKTSPQVQENPSTPFTVIKPEPYQEPVNEEIPS